MREYANQILQAMYNDYITVGSKRVFPVAEPTGNAGFTAQDVVKFMSDMGYVKNPLYRPGNVTCILETGGIEHIAPEYFDLHIGRVVNHLYLTNTRGNIHAILGFPNDHLQRSMDIGGLMQRRNLIQSVQTTGAGHIAEISPIGRVFYEDNKASFID